MKKIINIKFEDLFKSLGTKKYQISSDSIKEIGNIPVIDQSQDFIAGYSDEEDKINTDGPVILFGDHTLALKYIDFNFIVGGDGAKILINKLGDLKYLYYLLQNKMPKSEGYKRHFSILKTLEFSIPESIEEQKQIADFLTAIDDKIELLIERKAKMEEYKKGVMQQIFNQDIRFKDDNGNDYADWKEVELGKLLDYIQPTKYLVSSTEYNDKYKTPVLTAGKTFILGYTNEEIGIFDKGPVIIFDDFTTDIKYVDFNFKAKSSAMKILSSKGSNIYYLYLALSLIPKSIGEHSRHWISDYQNRTIKLPEADEQEKIANFLSEIDKSIENIENQIEKTKEYKNGIMQQIFI